MRTALALCGALACLAVPAVALAGAAAKPVPVPFPAGLQTDGDSYWTSAAVPDKAAFARGADTALAAQEAAVAAAADNGAPAPASYTRAQGPLLNGYNRHNIAGSYIDVGFNDAHHIHRGFTTFCVTFDSGSGSTHWFGSSPFNARSLHYSQHWHFEGINVSVNVPGGAGFSGGGSNINWSHSYSTLWMASHGYTGIRGCVGILGIMYNVSESHAGDWQITATNGALVQANASAGVI
jgi:hypothetical protein